jgi:hypothetical protein
MKSVYTNVVRTYHVLVVHWQLLHRLSVSEICSRNALLLRVRIIRMDFPAEQNCPVTCSIPPFYGHIWTVKTKSHATFGLYTVLFMLSICILMVISKVACYIVGQSHST